MYLADAHHLPAGSWGVPATQGLLGSPSEGLVTGEIEQACHNKFD